jgi:DNA-binding HxlR family transcriptional regulator
MMHMSQQPDWNVLSVNCPSRTSLARIANRWTAMIVTVLGDRRMRFGDIRTAVEGISSKVLTETLRELERDGLVTRSVFAEVPPRVEYELTPLGSTLYAPLLALCRWAEDNMTDVLRARDDYDARA